MVILTKIGEKEVSNYIDNLYRFREEILTAGWDTAKDTILPDKDAVMQDIEKLECKNQTYENKWNITDHCCSEEPIYLIRGTHYNII